MTIENKLSQLGLKNIIIVSDNIFDIKVWVIDVEASSIVFKVSILRVDKVSHLHIMNNQVQRIKDFTTFHANLPQKLEESQNISIFRLSDQF